MQAPGRSGDSPTPNITSDSDNDVAISLTLSTVHPTLQMTQRPVDLRAVCFTVVEEAESASS